MFRASDMSCRLRTRALWWLLLTIASFHVEFSQFQQTTTYSTIQLPISKKFNEIPGSRRRPAERVPRLSGASIKKFWSAGAYEKRYQAFQEALWFWSGCVGEDVARHGRDDYVGDATGTTIIPADSKDKTEKGFKSIHVWFLCSTPATRAHVVVVRFVVRCSRICSKML